MYFSHFLLFYLYLYFWNAAEPGQHLFRFSYFQHLHLHITFETLPNRSTTCSSLVFQHLYLHTCTFTFQTTHLSVCTLTHVLFFSFWNAVIRNSFRFSTLYFYFWTAAEPEHSLVPLCTLTHILFLFYYFILLIASEPELVSVFNFVLLLLNRRRTGTLTCSVLYFKHMYPFFFFFFESSVETPPIRNSFQFHIVCTLYYVLLLWTAAEPEHSLVPVLYFTHVQFLWNNKFRLNTCFVLFFPFLLLMCAECLPGRSYSFDNMALLHPTTTTTTELWMWHPTIIDFSITTSRFDISVCKQMATLWTGSLKLPNNIGIHIAPTGHQHIRIQWATSIAAPGTTRNPWCGHWHNDLQSIPPCCSVNVAIAFSTPPYN